MTRRAELLAARRELLLARSAYLRADLQYGASVASSRLRFVDTATAFARSTAGRVLLLGGAALLLLTGPRRVVSAASRLVAVWPIVRPWVQQVSARSRPPRSTGPATG